MQSCGPVTLTYILKAWFDQQHPIYYILLQHPIYYITTTPYLLYHFVLQFYQINSRLFNRNMWHNDTMHSFYRRNTCVHNIHPKAKVDEKHQQLAIIYVLLWRHSCPRAQFEFRKVRLLLIINHLCCSVHGSTGNEFPGVNTRPS